MSNNINQISDVRKSMQLLFDFNKSTIIDNSSSNIFNIEKAMQLFDTYAQKRQFSKAFFIAELVGFQFFFGNKNIVNCNLSLNRKYRRKTAESVLSDMNYKIVYFYSTTIKKYSYSTIAFSTAEG